MFSYVHKQIIVLLYASFQGYINHILREETIKEAVAATVNVTGGRNSVYPMIHKPSIA